MRIKYNMVLLVIVAFLLIAIIGITGLPDEQSREMKVNKEQLPAFVDANNVEIVWDVSGSMWGKVAKNRKYLRARQVLREIVSSIPDNVKVGLRVFGINDSQDEVTKLAVKVAKNNKPQLLERIKSLKPAGESPIGKALLKARDDLKGLKGNNHILLVTDGKDTGNIMPGKIAKQLYNQGIQIHVLQVGSSKEVTKIKLKSIAKLGGGKYFTYSDRHKVVPTMNLTED